MDYYGPPFNDKTGSIHIVVLPHEEVWGQLVASVKFQTFLKLLGVNELC